MIPKTNMKVVIPNMIILGKDDVKPGLLLESRRKHALSFSFERTISQEDVDRSDVEYDINACDTKDMIAQKLVVGEQRRVVLLNSPYTIPTKRLSYTVNLY